MIKKVKAHSFLEFLTRTAFIVLLQATPAFAEEAKKERGPWEERFIHYNIKISEFIDGVAKKIDRYLVGDDVTKRENETSVRIENISNSTEGETVTNISNLNINLRLPNVEDYFQLKFTTYDPNEDRGSRRKYVRPVGRPRNYGATVGLFRKLGDVRTAFQPRIELQDPLKVSHSLSFDTTAKMNTYEFNPKLEFFANPDKGTGIFVALNYAFFMNDVFTLNWINEGEYEEKRNQFSTNLGLSLVQEFNERSTFAYSLFFLSNNRPVYHLEAYSLSVTYSQLLYKRILDFQLIPHLDFSTQRNFKGAAGLTFVLNLNF